MILHCIGCGKAGPDLPVSRHLQVHTACVECMKRDIIRAVLVHKSHIPPTVVVLPENMELTGELPKAPPGIVFVPHGSEVYPAYGGLFVRQFPAMRNPVRTLEPEQVAAMREQAEDEAYTEYQKRMERNAINELPQPAGTDSQRIKDLQALGWNGPVESPNVPGLYKISKFHPAPKQTEGGGYTIIKGSSKYGVIGTLQEVLAFAEQQERTGFAGTKPITPGGEYPQVREDEPQVVGKVVANYYRGGEYLDRLTVDIDLRGKSDCMIPNRGWKPCVGDVLIVAHSLAVYMVVGMEDSGRSHNGEVRVYLSPRGEGG